MKQLKELTENLLGKSLFCLLLLVGICVSSCKDDPTFPDPGIDMGKDQDVVIWRDTADTYTIRMQVSTPGGLKVLEILNANDDALITDLSGKFAGQEEFTLEYEIALPDQDTVLSYNIRIVDEQLRVINKQFNVTVKAASKPVIEVVGGLTKSVISPRFMLKAKLTTGLNMIKEYKLSLDKKVLDSKVFEADTNSWNLEYLCDLDMSVGETYTLTLVLTDKEEKVATADINVMLSAGNKPIKVVIEAFRSEQETAHRFNHMYFMYDEQNRVQSIQEDFLLGEERTTTWNYNFTYNEQNKITELRVVDSDTTSSAYIYTYDENGRLKTSSRGGSKGEVDPNATVTVTNWDGNGLVTSFVRGATAKVEDIRYEESNGETVLVDYIWNAFNVKKDFREHFVDNTFAVWPTYCPELPPFFAERIDEQLMQLFCFKYIYAKRVSTNGWYYCGAGESVAEYTHEVDSQGRVSRVQIAEPYWSRPGFTDYTIYTFEYAE